MSDDFAPLADRLNTDSFEHRFTPRPIRNFRSITDFFSSKAFISRPLLELFLILGMIAVVLMSLFLIAGGVLAMIVGDLVSGLLSIFGGIAAFFVYGFSVRFGYEMGELLFSIYEGMSELHAQSERGNPV